MENLGLALINPNTEFWTGKRVLLTGHTGFKGAWLALWLGRMGAQVTGIGLPPTTEPNLFSLARIGQFVKSCIQDLRDASAVAEIVQDTEPEIVFHLAAQPLVRASYNDPLGTFSTNIQGTANLLDALRYVCNLKAVVAVTTDKVYQFLEHPYPYRETDTLGGHDPYSASKAAAELVIASYRAAFLAGQGVVVASARAGNVIGGGDWSEDRLIPDAVRAWGSKQPLEVRRPQAVRPWQHVLESITAYLVLAEKIWHQPHLAGAYNFGPKTQEAATVREVITLARKVYGAGEVNWADSIEGPHEANWLSLEIAKARQVLGINPRWDLHSSIERTLQWYRRQALAVPARQLCEEDIAAFQALA